MDDAVEKPQLSDEPNEAPWPPQATVTPADFRSIDYNAIVRDLKSAYDSRLENEFVKATRLNRDNELAFSVYRLLAFICSLHFPVHDKAGAFGAKMTFGNGRTHIAEAHQIGMQLLHCQRLLAVLLRSRPQPGR